MDATAFLGSCKQQHLNVQCSVHGSVQANAGDWGWLLPLACMTEFCITAVAMAAALCRAVQGWPGVTGACIAICHSVLALMTLKWL